MPIIFCNIRVSSEMQMRPIMLPSSSCNGVPQVTIENLCPDLFLTGNFPLQHFPVNMFPMMLVAGSMSSRCTSSSVTSRPIASDAAQPYIYARHNGSQVTQHQTMIKCTNYVISHYIANFICFLYILDLVIRSISLFRFILNQTYQL